MSAALAARVAELRGDRSHGASWMARRAVEGLIEIAEEQQAATSEELVERLVDAGGELVAARPAMGAIAGAVGRVLVPARQMAHLPPDDLRRLVADEARALIARRDRAAASIAIQLAPRLRDAFVLTHSASATVREAFLHTPPERVRCTVSEPHGEGRPFAEELRKAGLTVEVVADEEAEQALTDASLFLVGADSVYRDGALCNKVGTERIARAAQEQGVPTIVACEVIKLVPVDAADAPPVDEEGETFDLTPPELIDEIVTEEGTISSDEVRSLVDRTPFLSVGYELLRGGSELRR